jgi:hypothetical protein
MLIPILTPIRYLLRGQRRVFRVLDSWKQQHEFVPTLATDGVRLPHTPHQAVCHRLQQLIPHCMSKRVVDMFELIQIHEHHRQLPALTTRQLYCLAKPVLQQYSIRQVSEHIVMSQMIHISLSRLDLFSQFVGFNGSDDQVCVRFLQPDQLIVGRCQCRLCHANFPLTPGGCSLAQMSSVLTHAGSIFTQMRDIFSRRGQVLAA